MFINKIGLFFLFISSIAFSQTKKKVDTIFVHEKVFVYKTISKTDKHNQQFDGFDSITRKKTSEVKPFINTIVADTVFLKGMVLASQKIEKKKNKTSTIIDNFGISIQSLFSQLPGIKNYGGGIGAFASKNIYNNKLFLNIEFLFSKVYGFPNTKSIDGYYITPDAVLYYQAKNVKTQQLSLPITVSWKHKKIKPQIGVAFVQKQTELDFSSYKNDTAFNLVQKTSYKLTNTYIDFMYGIEYGITKRIGISLRSKQTLVKINDNTVPKNLKQLEELHFFPNQVIFAMVYNFKE
jgi:hypothetical protein